MNRPIRSSLLFVGIALLLVGTASVAKADQPNCYVLSVGIDHYRSSPLNGCINDAHRAVRDFMGQKGVSFREVHAETLLDQSATSRNVRSAMTRLEHVGKAGDTVVLFLSGHGARPLPRWDFVTYDYEASRKAGRQIDDRTILKWADTLASRKRIVWIVVDACFSGQLGIQARKTLAKHRTSADGGILLLTSSLATQESQALGKFSAFAHAVDLAMTGKADANRDGVVTFAELRAFATRETLTLTKQAQRCEFRRSPSIPDRFVIAGRGGNAIPSMRVAETTRSATVIRPSGIAAP